MLLPKRGVAHHPFGKEPGRFPANGMAGGESKVKYFPTFRANDAHRLSGAPRVTDMSDHHTPWADSRLSRG
jgi:hypothetical protein